MKITPVAFFLLLALATTGRADSIATFDHRVLAGTIVEADANSVTLRRSDAQFETISVEDATTILIDKWSQPTGADLRLSHPKLGECPAVNTDGISMRKGVHKFVLAFVGKPPNLFMADENGSKRPLAKKRIACPKRGHTFVPSAGIDEDGFRRADQPTGIRDGATYRHYRAKAPVEVSRLGASEFQLVKSGHNTTLTADWSPTRRDLGIFTFLVRIPKDGRYRFWLEGNKNSLLYLGVTPPDINQVLRKSPDKKSIWTVRLNDGGRLSGDIQGWSENGLLFKMVDTSIPDLLVPTEYVSDMQRIGGDVEAPLQTPDLDVVIAKVSDDRHTQIEGKIQKIEDRMLFLEYKGQVRKIKLDRILALRPATANIRRDSTFLLVQIGSSNVLPATFKKIEGAQLTFVTTWGKELQVTKKEQPSLQMKIQNGRVQYLSDLDPTEVSLVPFFDRIIPWQRDKALDGSRLTVGDQDFDRGLAMHSKTILTYRMGRRFHRFLAVVGIDPKMKDFGHAGIEVRADGNVVFQHEVVGKAKPIEIDVVVEDATVLTIHTDFGEGQDVGDRVHWGDARVVRSSSQ